MSKKKKKKRNNNNNNNLANYEKFLEECNEFNNMHSEIEKQERSLKLLKDSEKIKKIKEKDEPFYYASLAEIYFYVSKREHRQYNFSNGIIFNVEAILDEKNRKNLEDVIKNEENALKNYNKCLDAIKHRGIAIDSYERFNEGIRIVSQELSTIYYLLNEDEKFLFYGKCAIEYGSLNSIYVFLKYYCDKQDYDNAFYYYKLMSDYTSEKCVNLEKDILIKKISYSIYYNFLYDLGMYDDSIKVARESKRYIENIENIENNSLIEKNFIKDINEHIKKCEHQIDDLRKIQYKEDALLKYFDNEILKLMSDDNKIYILTSLNIYEYMKSVNITMDYSATLMPILKAIENIMFDIVAKKYHTFIMEKDENTLDKKFVKNFLNSNDEIIKKFDRLELGKILSLIGYKDYQNDEIIPNKYFRDFCDKHNVKNSKEVITKMYNELRQLTVNRNLVAHKDRVDEERVKECYDILLNKIKFINFLYENFKFVFENETKENKSR